MLSSAKQMAAGILANLSGGETNISQHLPETSSTSIFVRRLEREGGHYAFLLVSYDFGDGKKI